MYLLELKDADTKTPQIKFYGKLEKFAEIKKEVLHFFQQVKSAEIVMMDLAGVESINDECLLIFSEIAGSYKLQFINYSLFIEHRLRSFNLISGNEQSVLKS